MTISQELELALKKAAFVSSPSFDLSYLELKYKDIGYIFSEEIPGKIEVTICSLFEGPEDVFYEGNKIDNIKLDINELRRLIDEAEKMILRMNDPNVI
jgi:hypothetical protein